MSDKQGFIYILTNPSFPQYVKIGYTKNLEERLKEFNNSTCIPFAFRIYAYYETSEKLTDLILHDMIDKLNPSLRSVDYFNGKKRKREFYAMDAQDAFSILECIAQISNTEDCLHLVEPSESDIKDDEEATEIRIKRTSLPKMDWLIKHEIVHVGDEIYVINHPDEVAVIVNSDKVNYKGEEMSFNQFGCKVTGWKSIQCYAWMKIKGQNDTLADLREKKMKELGMIE